MKVVAVAIVFLGTGGALLYAAGGELDATAKVILGFVVAVGALVVAVAIKASRGTVQPGKCDSCGGLISPNAPYCKHCGRPRAA